MNDFKLIVLSLDEGRQAVKFCDSYTRIPTLIDLYGSMEVRDWLTLLGEEWENCANIGHYLEDLNETHFELLLEDPLEWRDAMMTEREQAFLAGLPEQVTVFRGCYAHNKRGLSWSLDPAVAAEFPTLNRYQQDGQPLLVCAKIKRDKILAVKLERDEAEIIAERPKIFAIRHIRTTSKPERQFR